MNPTERYFKAYDHLDDMERSGCSSKRTARLRAWVDKLADESADALAIEARVLRNSASIGYLFADFNAVFVRNSVSQRNRKRA